MYDTHPLIVLHAKPLLVKQVSSPTSLWVYSSKLKPLMSQLNNYQAAGCRAVGFFNMERPFYSKEMLLAA